MASGEADTFYTADMGDCGTGLCALPRSLQIAGPRRSSLQFMPNLICLPSSRAWILAIRLGCPLRGDRCGLSEALAPNYVGVNWVGGNEFSAVQGARRLHSLGRRSYDNVLPNLDFRLGVTDDVVAQTCRSAPTMTRPNYADIQGVAKPLTSCSGSTAVTATAATRTSSPSNRTTSMSLIEWYYSRR